MLYIHTFSDQYNWIVKLFKVFKILHDAWKYSIQYIIVIGKHDCAYLDREVSRFVDSFMIQERNDTHRPNFQRAIDDHRVWYAAALARYR